MFFYPIALQTARFFVYTSRTNKEKVLSEEVLTTAFVRLRKKFLQQARTMLPSLEDAEDALQEAFVRLWPNAEKLLTQKDVEAVTKVTIRHIAIDQSRRKQPSELVVEEARSDDLDDKERLAQAEMLMQQLLTPLQRDIIRLREYEDRPYSEVAATLNMTETAVRMQLSRARKILREAWKKQL